MFRSNRGVGQPLPNLETGERYRIGIRRKLDHRCLEVMSYPDSASSAVRHFGTIRRIDPKLKLNDPRMCHGNAPNGGNVGVSETRSDRLAFVLRKSFIAKRMRSFCRTDSTSSQWTKGIHVESPQHPAIHCLETLLRNGISHGSGRNVHACDRNARRFHLKASGRSGTA